MVVVEVLFELIRYSIKQEKLSDETLKGLSQDTLLSLYKTSKMHDIAHLVADALYKNGLLSKDDQMYKPFVHQENLAVYRYENINYELHRVCDLFEKNKVSHIPLKGSVIRSLYPEPWMRTSCDIDILIHEDDIDRALELLREQGARVEQKSFYDVSIYTENNVHIELHFNLAVEGQNKKTADVLQEVWDKSNLVDGCAYRRKMTDEMYYFYHLAHMSKHFAGRGCGIRSFIDVWILDNQDKADVKKRREIAERGGLDKFMDASSALAKVWLGQQPHTPITLDMQDFILGSGVYGNMENHIIAEQKKRGGKFGLAMSRIFLPYKQLKGHYPVLVKHKWLYPFCQVRRWFKLLFCGGVKRSVKELKSIAQMPKDKIKRTEKMMYQLGLWV